MGSAMISQKGKTIRCSPIFRITKYTELLHNVGKHRTLNAFKMLNTTRLEYYTSKKNDGYRNRQNFLQGKTKTCPTKFTYQLVKQFL
uniref:Uncharacterized protein n=1 Tax=Rhizophora mucronata TaxID=61149 RepID=A0A2P2MB44_RHIMU